MAFFGVDSGTYTKADADRKREIAKQLMGSTYRAKSPLGALAMALEGSVSGLQDKEASGAESAGNKAVADLLANKDYAGVMGNEWSSPQQSALASMLQGRDWDVSDRREQYAREDARAAQAAALQRELAAKPGYEFENIDGDIIAFDKRNPSGGAQTVFDGPEPQPDPTALMQNLEAAGLKPGTTEYNDAVLKSLGGTTVNVGGGEGQYDKTLGENLAKSYIGYQDAGRTGQSSLNTLSTMEQQMNDPGFYSGAFGDTAALLKKVGAGIGLDPEGAASIEGFNSLAKQSALNIMGGSLGTGFSNADRDFVMDQVANVNNTEAGNRKIIGIQKKLAQRQVDVSKLASDYAASHNGRLDMGFDAYLRDWAAQNPLFTDAEKGQSADWTDLGNGIRIREK